MLLLIKFHLHLDQHTISRKAMWRNSHDKEVASQKELFTTLVIFLGEMIITWESNLMLKVRRLRKPIIENLIWMLNLQKEDMMVFMKATDISNGK